VDQRPEVLEDLRKLVDAGLDFADLLLALLDEGLLVRELVWGQLLLENLRLALRGGILVLGRGTGDELRMKKETKSWEQNVLGGVVDRHSYALHDGALTFHADLLSALELDQGCFEVVRRLLHRRLLTGLRDIRLYSQ
jgi:hypothetical protein